MKKYPMSMYMSDDGCAVFTMLCTDPATKNSKTYMCVAKDLNSATIGDALMAMLVDLRIAGYVAESSEVPDATTEKPEYTGSKTV